MYFVLEIDIGQLERKVQVLQIGKSFFNWSIFGQYFASSPGGTEESSVKSSLTLNFVVHGPSLT